MKVATILARLLLLVGTVVLSVGCAEAPSIALRTLAPPDRVACPAARTEGILARNPLSGVGLRDEQGSIRQVIWPTDYTARVDGGRLAVLDGAGTVIAYEGDRVELGGQNVGAGDWLGCGGMRLIDRGE